MKRKYPTYKLITLYAVLLSFFGEAQNYPKDYFSSPLTIPLQLSGTFGELRSNHFHSGFDFKTQGVEGLPVLAAAEGQVSRIKISAYGFGNAIYMSHPNGYTTVYAHLQSLHPELAKWVKAQQYAQKKFEVDLFPTAGKFTFKKGEVIAKSGNSGGSGGAHLHFEIRDSKTEKTINPALFGLPVEDNRKPVIQRIYATPLNPSAKVLGSGGSKEITLKNLGNGQYSGEFSGSGEIGLLLQTYDQQNLSDNHNGIYEILQFVNDTLNYHFKIEQFAFDETRFINAHMDYPRAVSVKQYTHKCYTEPGNYLSVYPLIKNRGIIALQEGAQIEVKLIVRDSWGNQSEVQLTANGAASGAATPADTGLLDWKITHVIQADGMKVTIPAKTLYKPERIALKVLDKCQNCLSPVYSIGETSIPAHNRIKVSIHKSQLSATDRVVWANVNGRQSGLTSTWEGDWLTAQPKTFGNYAVLRDTVPPILSVKDFTNGKVVKKGAVVRMTATDQLSGITEYQANIDGRWVLLQHDAKNNLFWHEFEDDLPAGSHTLSVIMKDEVGNATSFQSVFTFQP